MISEQSLLKGKREEFRLTIRKECLEGLFQQNRQKMQIGNPCDPIIEIPHFSSTQELHKYLIDGEFSKQKLRTVGRDSRLLQQLFHNGYNYDYYSILILGNICTQQNIENSEELFNNQLKVAHQKNDIRMIANTLNALESLCSQELARKQLDYLLNNNLVLLINQIVKHHLHNVYTDEEFLMMQSAAGLLCRFMHQFKNLTSSEQEIYFAQQKMEFTHSLYLMKQLLPLQLQYPVKQMMFLSNILQIILFDPTLVEQLDNTCLQTCVKFLNSSNNQLLILTTLRFIIYLSSLDDEKFVLRLFYLKCHEVVKQYINHESYIIRQAAIKTLANFSYCSTETLQKELVSDHAFIAEAMSNFSSNNEVNPDELRLLLGIIDNCVNYTSEELIQDIRMYQIVKTKFITAEMLDAESTLLYLRILYTLITDYSPYCDGDSELLSKLESLVYNKNEIVSEMANNVIDAIKKYE